MGNNKKIPHFRLTTSDNPFDPFDRFNDWYHFDIDKGYNSSGLLARFIDDSDDLTDEEIEKQNEEEIDKIIKYIPAIDKYGNETTYKKVVKEY